MVQVRQQLQTKALMVLILFFQQLHPLVAVVAVLKAHQQAQQAVQAVVQVTRHQVARELQIKVLLVARVVQQSHPYELRVVAVVELVQSVWIHLI